ncbi:hypothetical protein Q1W71_05420 [Flavobacterium pectinovorum]|uniref:hypothetical protein n=1 Tax=Flavobacterium pectinovorum TaxID=29533 RepID=UPI00265E9C38|nr:hypothetical protein [Flavobacterium pectinovorum]WKL49226.1 hypothetical protein Q1W71_05420 [Flavobacterium pectinovorum]
MQNKYSFIVILLLTFLSGCMFFEKRIDKLYPQESKLTFDTFKRCERIIIDKNYLILQANAKYETEYYEPYLLFYKKSNLTDIL